MTSYAALLSLFRWLTLAGMTFACWRLLQFKLHRRYRAFFAYLVFSVVRSAILMVLDVRSDLYMKIWVLTQPIRWILCILLALEICSLILKDHRGIYSAGRWALWAAFGVALLFSAASLVPASERGFDTSLAIGFVLLLNRGLMFSLFAFLLLMFWFLSRYPIVLTRNLLVHAVVYSTYFIASSMASFVRSSLGKQMTEPVNALFAAVTAVCAVAWGLLLTPAGEQVFRKFHPAWAPGDERRLLEQLDSLNAALLRVSPK